MDRIDEYLSYYAEKTPKKIFLDDGKVKFNYSEFNALVTKFIEDNLSSCMRSKIAIISSNRIYYLLALFAVYRSSNIAVPLDYRIKLPELKRIFKNAKINKAILEQGICNSEFVDYLGKLHMIVEIKSVTDIICKTGADGIVSDKDSFPHELRLVLHTSGTTGIPKGVMLSDHNLIENATAIIESLKISNNDIGVDVLPLSHSFGNSIINSHLMAGSSITVGNQLFPLEVFKLVNNSTIFYGVPATYKLLLKYPDQFKNSFTKLRLIASAGGGLDKETLQEIKTLCPKLNICLMYGQTEASARLSYVPVEQFDKGIGTIGIPLFNVRFKILDEKFKPLPKNTLGEIAVSGPNIMLGYLNNKKETSKRIRDGWLLTGDIGYQNDDGFYVLSSRADDIIKVGGGYRVNPIEIEIILKLHPAVSDCLVFPVFNKDLGYEIGAGLLIRPHQKVTPQEIQKFCKNKLIGYKVPKKIVFLEELPKTLTGKISRNSLYEKYGK